MLPNFNFCLIVFFPDKTVKKWNYVKKLESFIKFLDFKFSNWEYINVYNQKSREYLKRLRKGEVIAENLKSD
jgi:hypothetical protein